MSYCSDDSSYRKLKIQEIKIDYQEKEQDKFYG